MAVLPGCLAACLLLCWPTLTGGQPAAAAANLFFDYGHAFADVAVHRSLPPSRGRLEVSEVCEGDTVSLGCPSGSAIQFANHSFFHFGHNGPWEKNTSCGGGTAGAASKERHQFVVNSKVANCTTVNGRRLLEADCSGRSACTVALTGRFPDRDPCPSSPAGTGPPERKYLIFRYSCVPDGEEKEIRLRSQGNSFSRLVKEPSADGSDAARYKCHAPPW